MRIASLLGLVAVLGVSTVALAEQIDNPEYAQWSKYKAGTYVTTQQAMTMSGDMPAGMPAGMDMSAMMPKVTTTTKLTEVKPDSLTLEVSSDTTQMGRTTNSKNTRTIPAKIDKPTATGTAPATSAAQLKDLKEGKDTFQINGKTLDTTTREYTATNSADVPGMNRGGRGGANGEAMPGESHVKIWSSPDVPGGMVKMEMTAKQQQMEIKTTNTVTDYKVEK